jgi:hypothetical protein
MPAVLFRYGSGYRLNLMSSLSRLHELLEIVRAVIPTASVARRDAGNVTVVVPMAAVGDMPQLLRRLERIQLDDVSVVR